MSPKWLCSILHEAERRVNIFILILWTLLMVGCKAKTYVRSSCDPSFYLFVALKSGVSGIIEIN